MAATAPGGREKLTKDNRKSERLYNKQKQHTRISRITNSKLQVEQTESGLGFRAKSTHTSVRVRRHKHVAQHVELIQLS